SVGAQLDGTAWSTFVSADDAEARVLPIDPDLALLGWWAIDVALAVGPSEDDEVVAVELDDGTDGLLGPSGWLDGVADRRAVVRIEGERLVIAAAEHPTTVTPAQAAAVRAVFDAM